MNRPSLTRYLWRWTLMALAAAWLALMLASYYAGLHEAGEIADGHLASATHVLLQLPAIGVVGGASANAILSHDDMDGTVLALGRHMKLARSVAVLVWENGVLVADTRAPEQRGAVSFPDGYATTVAPSGSPQLARHWRSFSAQRPDGSRKVTAMIDLDQPNRIVREVTFTIARPSLVVLPLVALLLWWAIRRGLRPLHALSDRVAALRLHQSERLDESHGFVEFASTVAAINALITRLQTQADGERAFASDVAHEMRTPLAAIALQAGIAARHPDAATRDQALERLQHESLRAGQILTQLLDLARAQRPDNAPLQQVALDQLAAEVMSAFAQASHESGHQLELQCDPQPVQVMGNRLLLELALRNLIANALDHTPAGTRVVVTVGRENGAPCVSVCDSATVTQSFAPDYPDHAHLGLGLRLVERIAAIHKARLVRDAAPGDAWAGGDTPTAANCYAIIWRQDDVPVQAPA